MDPQMQNSSITSPSFLAKNWPLLGAFAVVLIVGALAVSQYVTANADYINYLCSKTVDLNGACSNGSWGEWESVSTSNDTNTCVSTAVDRRVYTGTRDSQQTLQYVSSGTLCEAGYTSSVLGNGNGGGFVGGSIVTQTSVCQIEQTRTSTASITTGSCAGRGGTGNGTGTNAGTSTTVVTSSTVDTGTATTTSSTITSLDALRAARVALIGGSITAVPSLVRSGQTTTVRWNSQEMTTCSVSGSNGDTWQGLSGEKVSKALTQAATYTLNCTAFNGTNFSTSTSVTIVPSWQEQ